MGPAVPVAPTTCAVLAARAVTATAVVARTTFARLATSSAAGPRTCAPGPAVILFMSAAMDSTAYPSSDRRATAVRPLSNVRRRHGGNADNVWETFGCSGAERTNPDLRCHQPHQTLG